MFPGSSCRYLEDTSSERLDSSAPVSSTTGDCSRLLLRAIFLQPKTRQRHTKVVYSHKRANEEQHLTISHEEEEGGGKKLLISCRNPVIKSPVISGRRQNKYVLDFYDPMKSVWL